VIDSRELQKVNQSFHDTVELE